MNRNKLKSASSLIILVLLFFSSSLPSQDSAQPSRQYQHALRMIGEGNFDEAIAELEQVIQQFPDFSKAYRRLIEAYIFINDLERAQEFFVSLQKERPANPYAYYSLARIAFERRNFDLATDIYKQLIDLKPEFADAYSYNGGLPEVYKARNDLESGIQFFREKIESDPDNPCFHYGLARCYIRKYQWPEALDALSKTIALAPEFTLAYHSMIYIYSRTSNYDKVIEGSQKLLEIATPQNDFEMRSYAYLMLGNTYFFQGDFLKALNHLNDGLKLAKESGDKSREGSCLNTIAVVYALSANYPKALQYFKGALQLARLSGDKKKEVHALANIGNVYKDRGDYQQSLHTFLEVLQISRANNFKSEVSHALMTIAELYQTQSEYDKSLAYLKNALQMVREIKDQRREGFIFRALGSLHLDLGKNSAALRYYQQALEIGLTTRNAQVIWEAQAGLGATYEKSGQPQHAINHYAQAIALYDSVRHNLDIESIGSNFLQDKYEAYPSIVQLLAQKDSFKEAFTYAEKYKAKTVLDILSQKKSLFNKLLSDTLQLKLTDINSELEALHTLLSAELTKSQKDSQKIFLLDQKLADLELKKATLIERLKHEYGEYVRLTYSDVPDINTMRERIIREEEALIEYIVGPDKLSIFLLRADTLLYSEVEVGRSRLQDLMVELSPLFRRDHSGELYDQQILTPQMSNFSIPPAYSLYENLVAPLAPWLRGIKELIIVPDDVLFYLPFEMLVYDTTGIETAYDFGAAKFLLEKFDIAYAASAGFLEEADPSKSAQAQKGILAIGNPDFSSDADEIPLSDLVVSQNPISGRLLRGDQLLSLPNSETEVKTIDQVFNNLDNTVLIGNRATEEEFKSKAHEHRIIHLATHFLTNTQRPLYSKIVLAQQNKQKEDGYLQTYEVFDLALNADLVVLSACNSGLGQLRKGEGLIGISRAFQNAGVPSLVVSLWSVDDESTAMIMKHFYKHLKAGFDKRQALRLAKLDYLNNVQSYRKDPFFWAPFILLGDSAPLNLQSHASFPVWIYVVILSFLTVGIILAMRFWLISGNR